MEKLQVIGGGLAGSEAAWQAAERGVNVDLYEMRPDNSTGAHTTSYLAELICSNSLGSNISDRAPGLLKNELRRLGSLLIKIADEKALPAGGALAVDRISFAKSVNDSINSHPRISVIRKECVEIPDVPTVIATGPLTSQMFSEAIHKLTGQDHMYFFDAIAPIISFDSIDLERAFRASRYDRGVQKNGDYINCPMNETEYREFVGELIQAERIELKKFEQVVDSGVKAGAERYFEGCLPVEVLAKRGERALAFGPLRPVGLKNPRDGKRPYAVVQLRQDNLAGTLYNMVGFQTNIKFSEQKRIFRMIPGLENAEFVRLGQMHRNTFINSPELLYPTLQFKRKENLFFAGQITGTEGYSSNIGSGLLAGINAARYLNNQEPMILPQTTMLGALVFYITNASPKDYQPMKANFGILPSLEERRRGRRNKRERASAYAKRSLIQLERYLGQVKDF